MDNFDLKKFLVENKLTTNSKQLEENVIKNLVAATLMSLGIAGGVRGQEAPKNTNPVTWQQMTQAQKAAVKKALVDKGGYPLFQKYKDSISTDATNRREADIDKAAASKGMTRAEYERWYKNNKKKPDQPCGNLNVKGANKRGEDKGSCTTGDTNRGESLKDND